MIKILALTLSTLAYVAANTFTTACMFLWLDEPETPDFLIK
ncbi:MAG: cyclic lactone autoinducer peptide [Bacilli bacterium]|nr:cyclic lactone autoinducer peptide [Bacilli bacterium]MDD4547303.1 cyclic lactone autoinducer peptide [Bacilli bacterium]